MYINFMAFFSILQTQFFHYEKSRGNFLMKGYELLLITMLGEIFKNASKLDKAKEVYN